MKGLLLAALLAAAPARGALFGPKTSKAPASDPLRPLSAEEIVSAVSTVREAGVVGSSATFALVALREPGKDEAPAGRQAQLVVVDEGRKETSEAVVDLSERRLASWRLLFGVAQARAPFVPPAPAPAASAPRPKKERGLPAEITVDGNTARWDRWRFRLSAHPREGLVLSDVSFDSRAILHRASASEIVRVSGAAAALLEGEDGFGRRALSLEPRLDAPADAAYLDAVFADDAGKPFTVRRAIALFPRRTLDAGREAIARLTVDSGGRRYSQIWIFKQDGELESRVEVAGSTSAVETHFFSYRLDLDVDGSTNALTELSASGALTLRSSLEARRDASPALARRWLLGSAEGSGYALIPSEGAIPPAGELKRAPFLVRSLWALPYHRERLYAAGEYPSSGRADGLERWAREDESLEQRDLVLWHSFGATTFPSAGGRAQSPASAGFRLAPWGPRPDRS